MTDLFTIEHVGKDVVLTSCSADYDDHLIIPDEVTKIAKDAFRSTGFTSLTYKGATFVSEKLSDDDAFSKYSKRNNFCGRVVSNKIDMDLDDRFLVLLQNFLQHKNCLINVLQGNYFSMQTEDAYYYLESFLYNHFQDLSDDNKKWAERFMEHFSKSSVSGPAYAFHIYASNINQPLELAEIRLASCVYNLDTPWSDFAKLNAIYLSKIHMKRSGVPEEKLKTESAALLYRHRGFMGPAHDGVFEELNVDLEEMINIDYISYYDSFIESMKELEEPSETLDEFQVTSILSSAAADICKSIVPEGELELVPYPISMLEYFSNPDNYPSEINVDIDALVEGNPIRVKSQEEMDEELLKRLEHAFATHLYRIHFKPNPKFQTMHTGIFYMGFSDGWSYVIREKEGENYEDDSDRIVATYPSMKAVLNDGWKAD